MTQRRGPQEGIKTSPATGHREARVQSRPVSDAPVRELLVAGVRFGFTVPQIIGGGA